MAIELRQDSYELRAESPSGCEDTLSVKAFRNCVDVELENPWAGDSYSGFGQTASVRWSAEDFITWAEAAIAHVKSACQS